MLLSLHDRAFESFISVVSGILGWDGVVNTQLRAYQGYIVRC